MGDIMFKTYYVLKMNNVKYLSQLYNKKIYFWKIKYYRDYCLLYLDFNNYQKIIKYCEIYHLELIKIGGKKKYLFLIKKYGFFYLTILFSLGILFLLSNIIFEVKIMSDNEEIVQILKEQLDKYQLSKYRLVKSYREKEKIKENILHDYKDQIEWLEINRVGTKYFINVLERKKSPVKKTINYQNVVAKKNAIIREIKSSSGEIVKKVYDYVNKGDVIISGNIMKNDEVKDVVQAEGTVYGEVWYNVKVQIPLSYEESIYTGNSYQIFSISIFNRRFNLFKKNNYQEYKIIDEPLLINPILPFSLNKSTIYEVERVQKIYTYDIALLKGMSIAKDKLLSSIEKDSQIITQKKLKLYQENNIIVIEVFFQVYENITAYEEIVKDGE